VRESIDGKEKSDASTLRDLLLSLGLDSVAELESEVWRGLIVSELSSVLYVRSPTPVKIDKMLELAIEKRISISWLWAFCRS
jgi:hypothetical protein